MSRLSITGKTAVIFLIMVLLAVVKTAAQSEGWVAYPDGCWRGWYAFIIDNSQGNGHTAFFWQSGGDSGHFTLQSRLAPYKAILTTAHRDVIINGWHFENESYCGPRRALPAHEPELLLVILSGPSEWVMWSCDGGGYVWETPVDKADFYNEQAGDFVPTHYAVLPMDWQRTIAPDDCRVNVSGEHWYVAGRVGVNCLLYNRDSRPCDGLRVSYHD